MTTRPPIVVVDDDANLVELLVACLEKAGFASRGFARSREALRFLLDHHAALAVVDLYMPEMDGLELVRRLRTSVPSLPVIGLSGASDPQSALYLESLVAFGARCTLRKPVVIEELLAIVRDMVH